MKTLLAVIVVTLLAAFTGKAHAIQIAHTIAMVTPHPTIIGYQRVTTGKHWTWGGRQRKWVTVPIYAATPVPEAKTYAMLLAGLGLIVWRARCRLV